MSRPILVTLDLLRNTGGPIVTIDAFRRALDAQICSFCDESTPSRNRIYSQDILEVKASRLPLLKKFRFSHRNDILEAEKLAQRARLLSCHSFYRYHALWTHHCSAKYRVPYWHVPHGIMDPYVLDSGRLLKHSFNYLFGNRYLKDASCTIFATNREREKAQSVFGELESAVVNWPVEIPDISMDPEERSKIRNSWNIPVDAKVLVFFGRLHSMKRPLETIRAVSAMKDPSLYLVMIGPEGDLSFEDCYSEGRKCGLAGLRVIGPAYGDEKFKLLQACDVYISLSKRENFNHAAAESMAIGLPVVLSEGNDLLYEFKDDRFFFKVDKPAERNAPECIRKVLGMGERERADLIAGAQTFVQRNFSFQHFRQKIQTLLQTYGRDGKS